MNKLGVPATSGGRAFRTFAIAPYRLRGTPSAVLQSLTQKDAWHIKKSPVGIGFADGKSFSENFKAGDVKFSVSFGQKVTEFLKILTDF